MKGHCTKRDVRHLVQLYKTKKTRVLVGLGGQTHVECFFRTALTVGVSGVALTAETPKKGLKKAQAAVAETRELNMPIMIQC